MDRAAVSPAESWDAFFSDFYLRAYAHDERDTQAEGQALAAAQLEDSKRAAVRDLSTPILQVRAGLLILPVVGALDGERASLLAQRLLERIRATRARAVVVDLTGVPAFEPTVAAPLVHAVESARLMGARTIVTGLSAEIASALVAQDLDLAAITVAGDLQAGIEDAVHQLDVGL